jgi:hypothetical protein
VASIDVCTIPGVAVRKDSEMCVYFCDDYADNFGN